MLKILGLTTIVNYLFLNRKKPVAEKTILNNAIIPSQFIFVDAGFVIGINLNSCLRFKW